MRTKPMEGMIVVLDKYVKMPRSMGPWGWAARIKREQALVATAGLLGMERAFKVYAMQFDPSGYPRRQRAPRWFEAQFWLMITKNLEITETLTIEPYNRR